MLLFNPATYDPAHLDDDSRRALRALVGFFEGPDAIEASRHGRAVRRQMVAAEMSRYFGSAGGDLIDYTDTDWNAEEFTRGCYGAHLPPGAWTHNSRCCG